MVVPEAPTVEDKFFDGWFFDKAFTEAFTVEKLLAKKITEDINIYSIYSIIKYTIAFDSNDGSRVDSITAEPNTAITMPDDPTRDGYTFLNWYTDTSFEVLFTERTMSKKDTTVYAKWINNEEARAGLEYTLSDDGMSYEVANGTFAGTVIIIPDFHNNKPVTTMAENMFADDNKITSAFIGRNITSISENAFINCKSLTNISIPNSVTSIEVSAFYGCSALTSITIPDSVTSIGIYAFQNCSSLASITIPNSVTSIEAGAFIYCSSLTDVTISNNVTKISSATFGMCTALTSITIPNSVTSIGEQAFSGCDALTNITLPTYMTYMSDAFSDCTALTSITIPNSVTSIGYAAFVGCTALTSITIPESVISIGAMAFGDCNSLTTVYINSNTIAQENSNNSQLLGRAITIFVNTSIVNISDSYINQNYKFVENVIINEISYNKYK